jgi:hypothetical protein
MRELAATKEQVGGNEPPIRTGYALARPEGQDIESE